MNPWTALLDLLYPCTCPGCGRAARPEAPWCADCLRAFWDPRLIAGSAGGGLSGCYTCCQYKEGIRRCIIQLKYGRKEARAAAFPPLLAAFPWWARLAACDLAAAIPLSKERKKERGYNQTDLIFRRFLEAQGKTYAPDLLVRLRHTKVQSKLSLEERKENMARAFHVNRGVQIKGRSILLVDDVYTTGITMKEAARELRRAGARDVMGLAIASGAR